MATYRERPAAMQELLRGPDGPVVAYLESVVDGALAFARNTARSHQVTGDYDRSFRRDSPGQGPRGPQVTGRNISGHALHLEMGTAPHLILPKRPGGVLRFTIAGGQVVYAKRVNHPGTRPYRFLTDGLAASVAAH